MAKTYQTVIIFNPDLEDEIIQTHIDKFEKTFQDYTKNYIVNVDDMGIKNLAYEIKKHKKGYYVLFTWQGTDEDVNESERLMRIDDAVIKFMTIHAPEMISKLKDKKYYKEPESEQKKQPVDALDVLLGLASYDK